jgi:hypothetical protein
VFGSHVESAAGATDDLAFDKMLFIKRPPFHASHYYTFFVDGCDEAFHAKNNIYILDLKSGEEKPLVPSLAGGIFGSFELAFDASKVVFDYKPNIESGFRIWEVNIDGSGLRQLTFTPPDEAERIARFNKSHLGVESSTYNNHTDDMHPCYLPDGGICFVSSRCEYEVYCNPSGQLSVTVLYRMDGNGQNMEKLTNSGVNEFFPRVMNDGRIIYARWEYVDKNSLSIKSLWAMEPDGTNSVEIFGNDHNLPPTFWQPRAMPNRNDLFVFTGVPHFPQAGYGTVLLADTRKDIRTRKPLTYVTPDVDIQHYERGWAFRQGDQWVRDRRGRKGRLYAYPYPLSEERFLVSCKYDEEALWYAPAAYGIYLLDINSRHELIHRDPDVSCWSATPLRPRTKPPVLAKSRDPELAKQNLALCFVSDVHEGQEGVPKGTIKYIRINEQVPRPWGSNRPLPGFLTCASFPSPNAHLWVRIQHGIVPVEKDGSAYFTVPADRSIFFQTLDENYMEVQRERTYVNYRPGEVRSCVGCHEQTKEVFPSTGVTPLALSRPPSVPGPQPGEKSGLKVLSYVDDVQPVWDRHCVSCHGGSDPGAGLDLSGRLTEEWSVSYEQLRDRELVGVVIDEDRPNPDLDGLYLPPYSMGSHTSRLVKMLLEGHQDIELPLEDRVAITTWIDSNGQYYGTYYGRRHIRFRDHPNFRPVQTVVQVLAPLPPIPWNER